MSKEVPDPVLLLMAEKSRMLAEPTRLMILRILMSQSELNVSQIVEHTGSTQANISKHLKQLAEAGLVSRRKEGLHVLYQLDDPVVENGLYGRFGVNFATDCRSGGCGSSHVGLA